MSKGLVAEIDVTLMQKLDIFSKSKMVLFLNSCEARNDSFLGLMPKVGRMHGFTSFPRVY